MPPVIGFQTYLNNARQLVSQDGEVPRDGGNRLADRTLALHGHNITVVSGNGSTVATENARNDFIASFVDTFGEECRPIVEGALKGAKAKPLTARLIVELNAYATALKPSDMTESLSALLNRAAAADAGGVTHEQFQSLINANPALRAKLEPLNALRQQAEEAITRLGAFTGAEIAAAFRPALAVGDANAQELRETILVLIQTAVAKNLELSSQLRAVMESSHGETPEFMEMITRCDNRALEIQRLSVELSAIDANADDERLAMYVAQLLPKIALRMHGTENALELLRAELQPLATRFDSLRAAAAKGEEVGIQELALLVREITNAREAIKVAAKNGIAMPDGSVVRPDPGLFRSIDQLLNKLKEDVQEFAHAALEEKAKNWVNGVVPKFSATKLFTVYNDVVKNMLDDSEELERFKQEVEAFRAAAMAWAKSMFALGSMMLLNDAWIHLNACLKTFKNTKELSHMLLLVSREENKQDGRSERMEELKRKAAELMIKFQQLSDTIRRKVALAAGEDKEQLVKLQRLIAAGPEMLNNAARIQRMYDMLSDRREEEKEAVELNGSAD